MKKLILASFLISTTAMAQFNIGNVPFHKIQETEQTDLIEKMWKTQAVNIDQIYLEQKLTEGKRPNRFATHNPFQPNYIEDYESLDYLKYPLPANPESYILREILQRVRYYNQEVVVSWEVNPDKFDSVCALQFTDSSKFSYQLKTFNNIDEAQRAGYILTHHGKCGMCSSLKDLAVYLAKPDLTTPARNCSKKFGIKSIKSCYRDTIGFSNRCSEQWAYNSDNTRDKCGGTCIKYYGFLNVLRGQMDRPNTDEDGNLNICLACDEYKSGPGFKYGAGRTRRNSGITSAIDRPGSQIFEVDHNRYFEN